MHNADQRSRHLRRHDVRNLLHDIGLSCLQLVMCIEHQHARLWKLVLSLLPPIKCNCNLRRYELRVHVQ
jgi:hypothetical protein